MNIRYPLYEGVYRILTFNLPLSSLRFYLWLKIKRIDALSLVHPLNDIYFLGSVKIDLITSKSNST
jgi:hypothetical protein|nr:MAG TPA: hypothetical protein [Caudoviricetes sp.]